MQKNINISTLRNPYPGIRSFEFNEHELFFGRSKQIEDLYDRVIKNKFVAVTGASGSGKSSIIKAGLIPKLENQDEKWNHVVFRPGNAPLRNLIESLCNVNIDENDNLDNIKKAKKYFAQNHQEPGLLFKIFEILEIKSNFFIYVDQFEEIFRYKDNENIPEIKRKSINFIKILTDSVLNGNGKIHLSISLRTDFLSDCTEFIELSNLINDGHYLIPGMTEGEVQEAFIMPAKKFNAEMSENLKNRIISDIKEGNVSLPVIQHAMMRTWDYWLVNAEPGMPIDVVHYEAVGTVTDALSVHAEIIFSSFKEERQKKQIEKIFKALTFLGDGNRGIRYPLRFSELCFITESNHEEIKEIVNKFRAGENCFLLPSDNVKINLDTVVDISHESIMRVWKRLVWWVDEEMKAAQMYLRLSRSAELFQEGKTGLLVNPDLQLAVKWLEETEPNEHWALRYDPAFDRVVNYIETSRNADERAMQFRAEKNKKRLRNARTIAFILGFASLVSVLFLIIALNLRFKAESSKQQAIEKERYATKQGKIAESRKKEAVAQGLIAKQQQQIAEENRILAEEQKKYAVIQQKEAVYQKMMALAAKQDAYEARDLAKNLQEKAEKLRDQAIEEKKNAEEQRNRAEISEAKTDTLRKLAVAKSMAIQAVRIYASNKQTQQLSEEQKELPIILAIQSYYLNKENKGNPNNPEIFNAMLEVSEKQTILKGNDSHIDGVRDVAVSPKGKIFASCGDDGNVKIHKLGKQKESYSLNTLQSKQIRSVKFSDNGKHLAAGTGQGDILMWESLDSQEKPIVFSSHKRIVSGLCFLKHSLISSGYDGLLVATDYENGNSETVYEVNSRILTISKEPDTENIAFADANGNVIIINPVSKEKLYEIKIKDSYSSALSWISKDKLAVGLNNGKLLVFDKQTEVVSFLAHQSGINSITVDKKGDRIITGSYDGTVKIWSVKNIDSPPVIIKTHNSWVYSVALDSKGEKLISCSNDKTIQITEVDINEIKSYLKKQVSKNMSQRNWIRFAGEGIEYDENLPKD